MENASHFSVCKHCKHRSVPVIGRVLVCTAWSSGLFDSIFDGRVACTYMFVPIARGKRICSGSTMRDDDGFSGSTDVLCGIESCRSICQVFICNVVVKNWRLFSPIPSLSLSISGVYIQCFYFCCFQYRIVHRIPFCCIASCIFYELAFFSREIYKK